MAALERALFEIAYKDLEASRILFREKHYPQAVFFLQQSIEKSTKLLGLREKIITERKLKGHIGHKAWKVFEEMYLFAEEKFKELEDLKKQLESNRGDERLNSVLKMVRYMLDQINDGLGLMKSAEINDEMLDKAINIFNGVLGSETQMHTLNDILHQLKDIAKTYSQREVIKTVEVMEDFAKNISFSWKQIYWQVALFVFSYLMVPHAAKSRYPDIQFNPLEYYNEKNVLIKRFHEISDVMEKVLMKMRQQYGL